MLPGAPIERAEFHLGLDYVLLLGREREFKVSQRVGSCTRYAGDIAGLNRSGAATQPADNADCAASEAPLGFCRKLHGSQLPDDGHESDFVPCKLNGVSVSHDQAGT